eukprot:6652964-Pyramimonas_sp.AAC.1
MREYTRVSGLRLVRRENHRRTLWPLDRLLTALTLANEKLAMVIQDGSHSFRRPLLRMKETGQNRYSIVYARDILRARTPAVVAYGSSPGVDCRPAIRPSVGREYTSNIRRNIRNAVC